MTPAAPRSRVLVLDDDPATLRLEQRSLERAGYSVLAALTESEALDHAAGGGVEVMVLDYRLGGASTGLDVFQHLRERGHLAPAVLVTSFADESKIIEALRAGIRDVVPKSGDYFEYLPQAVDRVLGQLEAERKLAQSDMLEHLVDRLRVETQTLETINEVGRQLAAEHDVHVIAQRVVDACTSIVGAQSGAFFYTVVDEHGQSSMRYTTSGVLRERYGEGVVAQRTRLAAASPALDSTVLCEDVSADPRAAAWGAFPGLPDEHPPVRSHLAVPVASRDGRSLGALLFWHADPAVFHDREARIVEGVAAQASSAIDNARLIDALRTSEDRLRLATEAARQGTWDFNPVTGDLQWSDRCRELFGLSPGAPVSYDVFLQAVHPGDRQATDAAVKRALDPDDGAQIFEAEYRSIGIEDGRERWIRALGRAFFKDGRAERFLGIAQDVTAQRLASEEREQLLESERAARTESDRASRLKDEFLATLSHELRTPLNAVLGWAQLVRARARTPQEVADGLATIERNARAQAQIIDDLLDMSRIVSGKMRLDVQPIDLAALVESAVDGVRPAAEAKAIRLQTTLDRRAGAIQADPGRLQQVLWNLLSNALKFTPRDGAVHVTLAREDAHVELNVNDTGQGIRPEFLPYLFDRFRQGDASTTREHRGMGLGLSIVKSIVEMHGGTVTARSDGDGQGAAFIVRLPLMVTRQVAVTDQRRPAAALTEETAVEAPSLAGLRVLVVDDEPDARELVSRILLEYGADVVAVNTARDALDRLDAVRPDVIVSDLGLPRSDGYSLIREVRRRPRHAGGDVPALALTAFARSEDRRRALMAGYQAHLAKPAEPSELVTLIASLTGRLAVTRGAGP